MGKHRRTELQECENCGSIWSPGTEEHDWQVCSSCGWRPGQPIEDDFDEDDYFESEEDTPDSN